MQVMMTKDALNEFLHSDFPQVSTLFEVTALATGAATVVMQTDERNLRPGGTISGPSMFALADVAMYLVTLAHIGPEALTVTTQCSINFMRKPLPGPLRAEARLLKLGRNLSVGDVALFSDGQAGMVAHAQLTYSIPPKRG